MKVLLALPLLLPLLLTSCAADGPPLVDDTKDAPDQVAAPFDNTSRIPVTSLPAMKEEGGTSKFRSIVLNGYTCGDNCYLQYTPLVNGGYSQDALCSTPICAEWEQLGELPDELIGQEAVARFSVGELVDGNGDVMQEGFPKIIEIRIKGKE